MVFQPSQSCCESVLLLGLWHQLKLLCRTSIACRSSPFIFETLTNPETAFSDLPIHAPITRAFNMPCGMGMYQWLHLPEEEYRRRMFGAAMTGIQMMERDDVFECTSFYL